MGETRRGGGGEGEKEAEGVRVRVARSSLWMVQNGKEFQFNLFDALAPSAFSSLVPSGRPIVKLIISIIVLRTVRSVCEGIQTWQIHHERLGFVVIFI